MMFGNVFRYSVECRQLAPERKKQERNGRKGKTKDAKETINVSGEARPRMVSLTTDKAFSTKWPLSLYSPATNPIASLLLPWRPYILLFLLLGNDR
jgi:hypothetical protein